MIELGLALSLHLGFMGDYNAIHPHIRYTENNIIAGAYYNSENNVSFYGGNRWEFGDFGLETGAVTGYTTSPILPYLRGTYDDFFIAPSIEGKDNIGVVIGYEFKW